MTIKPSRIIRTARVKTSNLNTDITKTEANRNLGSVLELAQQSGGNYPLIMNLIVYAPLLGALMVEVWIGTMALQNLQQYGCQTGNKLKEKSRDLNRKSSRFFLTNKNETMFGSVYENSPEFGVLGGVIFKLDIV